MSDEESDPPDTLLDFHTMTPGPTRREIDELAQRVEDIERSGRIGLWHKGGLHGGAPFGNMPPSLIEDELAAYQEMLPAPPPGEVAAVRVLSADPGTPPVRLDLEIGVGASFAWLFDMCGLPREGYTVWTLSPDTDAHWTPHHPPSADVGRPFPLRAIVAGQLEIRPTGIVAVK